MAEPILTESQLRRRRHRLVRRLECLEARVEQHPGRDLSFMRGEISSLKTALDLFDFAIAGASPVVVMSVRRVTFADPAFSEEARRG